MGSVDDAYDNAMAESFFATLECELLDRRRFKSQAEAKMAVFEFIEAFYNPRRRHSSLGYLSPANSERQYAWQAKDPDTPNPAAVLGAVKARPGNGVPDGEVTATADPRRREGRLLTAPVRGGHIALRAETKERAPQGAKPSNRDHRGSHQPSQPRHHNRKPITVHQYGARPGHPPG